MAKAKARAAVKRKPAKSQPRATAARAVKTEKTSAKAASAGKPAKTAVVAKPAAAKTSNTAAAKTARKTSAIATARKTEPLTLPPAKSVAPSAAKPAPVAHKASESTPPRADLPPAEGFALLVDGHFKSSFGDLKGAKAAASELKGRFPMLRVEIYDATKKIRLPA